MPNEKKRKGGKDRLFLKIDNWQYIIQLMIVQSSNSRWNSQNSDFSQNLIINFFMETNVLDGLSVTLRSTLYPSTADPFPRRLACVDHITRLACPWLSCWMPPMRHSNRILDTAITWGWYLFLCFPPCHPSSCQYLQSSTDDHSSCHLVLSYRYICSGLSHSLGLEMI